MKPLKNQVNSKAIASTKISGWLESSRQSYNIALLSGSLDAPYFMAEQKLSPI
jgi:hypothetical protein